MNQLKTIYHCHACDGTLDSDCGGRALTVLDLDLCVEEGAGRASFDEGNQRR